MSSNTNDDDDDVVNRLVNAAHINENVEFDATKRPNLRDELLVYWNNVMKETTKSTSSESNDNNTQSDDEWFQRIYKQHNEDGRYYHTAVHLKEMLDYIDILYSSNTISSSQYVPMVLATFFHDVVYNPKSGTNEKDSAILFEEFAKDVSLETTPSSNVVTMIHATEKHQIIPMNDPKMQMAQEYFLDIDMSVLGKKSHAYLVYASLIRKEYSFVEHDTYCSKRAEILESFLEKTIYQSKLFQSTIEDQAKKNLQHEIDLLKRGIIPGSTTN